MSRVVLLLFFISLQANLLAQSFTRVPATITPTPEAKSVFEFVDVDGDGDMDILSFYPHPSVAGAFRLRLYENISQAFQGIENPVNAGGNIAATSFVLGDGNADGHTDILFVAGGTLQMAENAGDKSFATEDLGIQVASANVPLHWIDIDGDLDLDIVTKLYANRYTALLYENGEFTRRREFEGSIKALSFADINNDGLTDFLARMEQGSTEIWNTGSFDPAHGFPLSSAVLSESLKVVWTNIDSDQDVDLLALTTAGKWALFTSDGSATLTFRMEFDPVNATLAVANLNNDNLEDIILSGGSETSFYLNTSAGGTITFSESDLGITPANITSVHMVNFDDQLGLDFFFKTENTNGTGMVNDFYVNNTAASALPNIPSDLSMNNLGDGKLKLSWFGSGTYYRLEILKEGVPVASAESLPTGKIRRAGKTPIINSFFTYHIMNSPGGNYKWRVHALNAAQASTAFSSYKENNGVAAPVSQHVKPEAMLPIAWSADRIQWVDVDQDDDMDALAFFESAGKYSAKLYEDVGGSYHIIDDIFSNTDNISASAMVAADGIPDNYVDFLFVENDEIKVAINRGDKTFEVQGTGLLVNWGGQAYALYWIDMDGDGDLDVVTQPTGTYYAIALSEKVGPSGGVIYPNDFTSMSFADVNNDNLMDFFVVVGNTGYVIETISLTEGYVSQITGQTFLPGNIFPRWVDIENDGDLDLLAQVTGGTYHVFRNQFIQTGEATFTSGTPLANPYGYHGAAFGDFNSDGLTDIITAIPAGLGENVHFLFNQSTTGSVAFMQQPTTFVHHGIGFSPVDVDGVNGVDIVSNPLVYKNKLSTLSAPPPVPAGRTQSIGNGVITLSWATSGPGKTYRVEIYKDGLLYISSASGENGKLFLQNRAAELRGTSVKYVSVPPGSYSWRVQSVDASFRASAFSTPKTFSIAEPVTPPVTGIQEFHLIDPLRAYPNPANGHFTVNIELRGKLTVFNSFGQSMYAGDHDPDTQPTVTISTVGWSDGVYTIELKSGSFRMTDKVVVIGTGGR